jgi:hypothetical protein
MIGHSNAVFLKHSRKSDAESSAPCRIKCPVRLGCLGMVVFFRELLVLPENARVQ